LACLLHCRQTPDRREGGERKVFSELIPSDFHRALNDQDHSFSM
jgi:hypothetical protein